LLDFNELTAKCALGPEVSGCLRTGGAVKKIIAEFWADQSGATAIEYGLIAAGISLAIIAVVNGLGSNLNTKFSSINTSLK
jgi:pilus assembly protein Flp/PilA